MADSTPTPEKKESMRKALLRFYFSPELRSVGTLVYLGVFGFFTLYYIDNLFLAARFLFYIVFGHNALAGTALLFTGMSFEVALLMPFFISFYAILVLHKIWEKPHWEVYVKWLVTVLIILGSIFIVIISDSAARLAARQPAMQSFMEDANLTGRI